MTEENGEFDIIEDFGYLLINKAYEKTAVKLYDNEENEMQIEEWRNKLWNVFPHEENSLSTGSNFSFFPGSISDSIEIWRLEEYFPWFFSLLSTFSNFSPQNLVALLFGPQFGGFCWNRRSFSFRDGGSADSCSVKSIEAVENEKINEK